MNPIAHPQPAPGNARFSPWPILLLLALLASGSLTAAAVPVPRTIRVVLDGAYAPYSFRGEDGKLQGVLVDQWQLWEKKTGTKVELTGMNWAQALERMRAGEFDVIDTIVETGERRGYLDFTPEYAVVKVPIFFRQDISGITDLASLKGFAVGVKEGDQHSDKLRAAGVTKLIPFPNFAALIEAAKEHKINVFVADAPSALYLLNKAGLAAEFRRSLPVFRDGIQRAVRKGDAALLQTVMQGFAAIDPAELTWIDKKWFGRVLGPTSPYLAYAGYAAGATLAVVAGLTAWNRLLRIRVLERTAALGESEQRFRQIAENIDGVFWLTTLDLTKVLYVSPAYATIWGQSCESVYQDPHSFIAAIHVEDRPRAIEAMEKNRAHGFEIEYRVVRPDGSVRWIRDRGFPIPDGASQPDRIAGIAEDITERKLAAKQAEDRVRLTIHTLPAMVWSVRPDGTVDFLNQRWMDYAGLSWEEYIKDPLGPVHPEDIPGVTEKWHISMVTGESYEQEMRLRRADGVFRWFLVRTSPLRDEQGNIVRWFGSSFDIEDRKQAEMQSRVLIDAIPHQIWSGPADGTLDFGNERWRSYMGLRLDELQGSGWQAMLHPDERDQVLATWNKAVASGTPYEQEERHRAADGTYRWFLCRGVPQRDAAGHIVRWYGTNTDIEDRKQAEEALRRSEQQLHELVGRLNHVREDEAKRIARELHDDLGQKLTALNMELADLETKLADAPPAQRAQIAGMHATVDQTIEAVQTISSELRLGPLDILGLTAAIDWQLKEFSRRSGIPCRVTRLDEIPNFAGAQGTAVFRILQEALTNIVRHAGATEVEISLQNGADELVLKIRDNGRGITAAELGDRKSIGLLGMSERAEGVGGSVQFTGAAGQGTVVTVTVPVAPAGRIFP
ncbi:MAG: domain S-box-containing protein [Lacunisphaera sp.]|nr:domain S-box-containing protein [Lacunisphaera sp.]